MKKPIHSILLTALCMLAAPLAAQVPQIINYQGKIAVGATPFTGTGQFKFALVDGTGATSYWSNDGTSTAGSEPAAVVSLPVVNGLYVVPLGDTTVGGMTPIAPSVFQNSDVRLRVWFNDGSTGTQMLAPDQRITSVGYAMVAGTVPDGAITAAKLGPQARAKYDRQMVTPGTSVIGPFPAAGYNDMTALTLTTKDLGETGTYIIHFKTSVYSAGISHSTRIRLVINGTPIDAASAWVNTSTNTGEVPASISYMATGLSAGTVIKVHVASNASSSIRYEDSSLLIDGVPSSQVVP